jgi:hypothetical protein
MGAVNTALRNARANREAETDRAKIRAGWTPGYHGLVAPGKNAFGTTENTAEPTNLAKLSSSRTRKNKSTSLDNLSMEPWKETIGDMDPKTGLPTRSRFQESTGLSQLYNPEKKKWETLGQPGNPAQQPLDLTKVNAIEEEKQRQNNMVHTSFGSYDQRRMTHGQAKEMYANQNSPSAVAERDQFEKDNPFIQTAQGKQRRYTLGDGSIQVSEGSWNQDDWKAYDMEQAKGDGLMIPERKTQKRKPLRELSEQPQTAPPLEATPPAPIDTTGTTEGALNAQKMMQKPFKDLYNTGSRLVGEMGSGLADIVMKGPRPDLRGTPAKSRPGTLAYMNEQKRIKKDRWQLINGRWVDTQAVK